MKRKNVLLLIVVFILAAALGLPLLRGVAPTPDMFSENLSLNAALDRSVRTGRPVLAVVTADWCGACQALKRGALSDTQVERIVSESFVPVYVDSDRSPGEVAQIGRVEYLPTVVVIVGGREVTRAVGNQSAGQLRVMLEQALRPAPPAD
ncbi:MAG: thioredoxin family protein [Phycisphaerales bacterium]|nr:thioredoxin family protein [Phycisphaerales bacterium]